MYQHLWGSTFEEYDVWKLFNNFDISPTLKKSFQSLTDEQEAILKTRTEKAFTEDWMFVSPSEGGRPQRDKNDFLIGVHAQTSRFCSTEYFRFYVAPHVSPHITEYTLEKVFGYQLFKDSYKTLAGITSVNPHFLIPKMIKAVQAKTIPPAKFFQVVAPYVASSTTFAQMVYDSSDRSIQKFNTRVGKAFLIKQCGWDEKLPDSYYSTASNTIDAFRSIQNGVRRKQPWVVFLWNYVAKHITSSRSSVPSPCYPCC